MKTWILLLLFIVGISCEAPHKSVAPEEPSKLVNRKWVLRNLLGDEVTMEKLPYIIFSDSAKVHGFAGCNSFSGSYGLQGRTLLISDVMSTKMYCDHQHTEDKFLDILQNADGFRTMGNRLHLLKKDYVIGHFDAEQ